MGHRDNCPSDYEARSQARRDAARDCDFQSGRYVRSHYDCAEANEAYRREYGHVFDQREEEQQMDRQAERRREAQREETAYLMECEERAADDAQWAEQEYLASLEAMAAEQPKQSDEPEPTT